MCVTGGSKDPKGALPFLTLTVRALEAAAVSKQKVNVEQTEKSATLLRYAREVR